jgi:DtxR family Mn-dependent transcriptional regulator
VFERDRQLLVYLDELGLRPGATFQVDARNVDDTLSLRLNGKPLHLGVSAAARVWVKPQS